MLDTSTTGVRDRFATLPDDETRRGAPIRQLSPRDPFGRASRGSARAWLYRRAAGEPLRSLSDV
jgi:hypothetical protein